MARRDTPESEAWLGLLEAALGESEDGAMWEAAVPTPAAQRPIKAPVLSHAQITVDGRAARGWVRRLLKLSPQVNPRRIDGLALLEAAVCHDDARIDVLAAAGGVEPHALRVLGQMAALPLLQACARGLASELLATWWEGYCPLCGAWPVVAEYTGLERKPQDRGLPHVQGVHERCHHGAHARSMGRVARRLDDGPAGRRGARARIPPARTAGLSAGVSDHGATRLGEVSGGWWRLVEVAPARPPPSSRTSTILHRPTQG